MKKFSNAKAIANFFRKLSAKPDEMKEIATEIKNTRHSSGIGVNAKKIKSLQPDE